MDLNKIGYGENPDKVKAIIEIACGSNIKYEVEKESGALVLDRVMHSAMYYPANYGFVNKTLSQDGDPAEMKNSSRFQPQKSTLRSKRFKIWVIYQNILWQKSKTSLKRIKC